MNYRLAIAALAGFGLVLSACGDSDDDAGSASAPTTNACPVDGCAITILDAEPDGSELKITWEANFLPDFSKNHIHFYWDTYSPQEVSGNAETEYGETQGNWVPTDVTPSIITEGPTSVANRADSTTLCVTAADFDHNVLDPTIENCFDVSELL